MSFNRTTRNSAMALGAIALAVTAGACKDALVADNLSDPDISRVFSTPAAVEQAIGSGYQACHNNVTNSSLMPQAIVMGMESYSQLNNFNMNVRSTIPRPPILNKLGSPSVFGEFSSLSRAGRLVANALNALNVLIEADATPENGVLGSPERDLRARAFAFFAIGCHQGWLAMIYDSAGRVVSGMPIDSVPPLSDAVDVMDGAIQMLDSAVNLASTDEAEDGFPTEGAWLGGTAFERDEFVQLVRSFRARFRAGAARTPAERDAVDWPKVIADAEAGIDEDFLVSVGGSTGWNSGFISSTIFQDGRAWGQISLMYWGMADVSGGYDAWLALDLGGRSPFLVRTPDQRWPQGATRAAQVAAAPDPTDLYSLPYIDAFAEDETAEGFGWSYYQHQRLKYIRIAGNEGDFPDMYKAEMDLLAAEGYIRNGDIAEAAQLIDITRVGNGGLPALSGVITAGDQPVPGGGDCVPRVPAPPAFASATCGDIWEAMKYEKRIETAYSSFGRWWIDGRGWGDLITNTPTEFPVPFQEMSARQKPSYNVGGGGISSAARGTYGF